MRKISKYLAILFCLFSLSAQFVFTYEAEARPGGGSSYRSRSGSSGRSYSSGSSRTYSSGGYYGGIYTGSSGGGGIETIIITVFVIVLIVSIFQKFKGNINIQQQAGFVVSADYEDQLRQRNATVSQKIEELKQRDPNFSKILFLDFTNSLYNKFYNYLNSDKSNNLKPFFRAADINKARESYTGTINEIVVGSINIISISEDTNNDYISVEIEANYTAVNAGRSIRYLTLERWKLFRKKQVLSKDPVVMRTVACPNCSAPSDFTDAGQCNYCKTFINKGEMQWAVENMYEVDKEQFTIKTQRVDVEEEGTDYPTLINSDIAAYKSIYLQRNNISDWQTFWEPFKENIVENYFNHIYKSWSENRLIEVRALLSDRLYESFDFWIYAYKRDGLINKLENISISRIEPADIDIDRFYDSVTVRIYASANDYIQNSNGKIISGSKSKKRNFSEYWTFIKKSGLKLNERNTDLKKCPSCSAPVENIGQAGKCEYCGSKISDGDFSWVLAIITQDEVYQG